MEISEGLHLEMWEREMLTRYGVGLAERVRDLALNDTDEEE